MSWTESDIEAVWSQAQVVDRINPRKWRKDACGAWISRDHFGDRNSHFGWEIGRIVPEASGGTDDLANLRPLQWRNASSQSNGKLVCRVVAYGGDNLEFD